MCRNIKTLANFAPPATEDEIRASALQFVRKLSGVNKPSKANEDVFNQAVDAVTEAAERLIRSLKTSAPPKDREEEARKAKERAREPVEEQNQQERRAGEHGGEGKRFAGGDLAGGKRPRARALDMAVEIAVGVVVHCATRRAHEQGADYEDQQDVESRPAAGRQPYRPQRRPQQKQRADRLVEADEALVGIEAPGDERQIHRADRITQAEASSFLEPSQRST